MPKRKFAGSIDLYFNLINIKINNKSNFIDFLYITRLFKLYTDSKFRYESHDLQTV